MLVMIQFQSTMAQPKQLDYLGMEYTKWIIFVPGNDSVAPYYISSKPVTNKEYILYLAWTAKVYGLDYSEVLLKALPGVDFSVWNSEYNNPFADSLSFRYYLEHSQSYVSEYIFNPIYLNSAVIGITWEQANKYCHWLSDRYNEYCLIKKKYLMIDPSQHDENNFTTESFIFLQYEGVWGKTGYDEFFSQSDKKGFDFVKYLLRPSFHLATQYELLNSCKDINLVNCFCSESKGSEFLSVFYKYYLREHKGYIYVDPEPEEKVNKSFYLVSNFSFKTIELPKKISEWCLDSYLTPGKKSVREIYNSYGYESLNFVNMTSSENQNLFPQKDSLGQMQLIITGENNKREIEMVKGPVSPKNIDNTITPFIFDHNTQTVVNRNGDRFTTFRYSVNAIKNPGK
jgi:hypothetical protein